MKLLRVAATAALVSVVAAGVGRWLIDPCKNGLAGWAAIAILLLGPATVAFVFSLPRLAMLRYFDNAFVACLVSPIALAIAVDDHGAACGVELVAGALLLGTLIDAVAGVALGALLLWLWLRRRKRTEYSEQA